MQLEVNKTTMLQGNWSSIFFSLENPIFCSQQRVSNAFEMLANQLMLCLIFQQETRRLNLFEFDLLTDRPTGFVYYKNHIT